MWRAIHLLKQLKSPVNAEIYFIAVALVATCGSAYATGADVNIVGSVAKLHGRVELKRNGQKTTPTISSKVLLGDVFTTQRSASMVITLQGGSELDLGESSSIRINRDLLNSSTGARLTLIRLLAGKLHSLVPSLSRGGDFSVLTGNAISGVRGTDFEVSYIEGKPCPGFPDCLRYTDVGVRKGTVEVKSVTNPHAPAVMVRGGYETTVPCEEPPSSPSPLGATELESPGYH